MSTSIFDSQPTTVTLNNGQQEALRVLNAWLDSKEPFALLRGQGGTGKSHVIKQFLLQRKLPAIITAPTTEALNNIAEDLPGYSYQTIHSLLGFRPAPTETERQILIKMGSPDSVKVFPHKILVLDEAYYCPGVLIKELVEKYSHLKILFSGDSEQFTPIGEAKSALLNMEEFIDYKAQLTENMRSSNPEQAALMKEVNDKHWETDLTPYLKTKGKCWRLLFEMIENGEKDFVFLAFHHKVVNEAAKLIRETMLDIPGDSPPIPGEYVRMTEVIDIDNYPIVRQNERVHIVNYTPEGFLCKRNTGEEVYIDLDFEGKVEEAKQVAIKSKERRDWAIYHVEKRRYGNILSAYASTTNSFQGRTTNQAIIDITDLKKSPDKSILNVAIGRSRNIPLMYL